MGGKGLTSGEAEVLLKKFGLNEIQEKKRRSVFGIFLSQFNNFLILLLVGAAAVSFFLGDRLDGFFILLIVVLNAVLGFVQEFKAEKAIEALKKITVSKIRVLRDGRESEIDSRRLVPGDTFFVEEGTKVPTDGRIVDGFNLEVNEASLTGESLPIAKRADGDAEEALVFAGTIVAAGRGRLEVSATGMSTRFGRIAAQLQSISEEETPLQKRIGVLGKQLGILGILASLSVLFLSVIGGNSLFESFLTSISLAVAAVPEGLPAVITITLAVGVQRMSKAKAVVRRLTAVEALGSTSVIVTDKTGTLTRNEMRVKELWFDGSFQFPLRLAQDARESLTLGRIVEVAALCNNASLVFKRDHGTFDVLGDTTEGALLLMVNDLKGNIETLRTSRELRQEYPFDAKLKTMSVLVSKGEAQTPGVPSFDSPSTRLRAGAQDRPADSGSPKTAEVLTKGAPESLLSLSRRVLTRGEFVPLDAASREKIEADFRQAASVGLRIIAFAFKPWGGDRLPEPAPGGTSNVPATFAGGGTRLRESSFAVPTRDEVEKDLVFLGFVGIYDPPRPEVKEAIKVCREAGIRVVMVTGDNELTAAAVAAEIGLIEEGEDVLIGRQIESYPDTTLKEILPKARIFARTSPEQKFRIVKAFQELGEVTAVTGDGVNDVLALKQADVGVAMGITGTDVAKEASDIVVTDDNFASIAAAVEEGRVIFENIKNAVKYLIGCNLGEVLAILLAVVFGWPLILTPIQLLYVNLVTDGLPAIALAVTPKQASLMKRRPRKNGGILGMEDWPWLAEISAVTALLTLVSFYLGNLSDLPLGRTLAFTTMIFVQHLVLVDVWSREESFLSSGHLKNPWFLTAFFLPLVLQPFLIYNPSLSRIFKLSPSAPHLLLTVILASTLTLFLSELRKRWQKRSSNDI